MEGNADAGTQQPDPGPDQALSRPGDRPAVVHDARSAGVTPLWQPGPGQSLPGAARRDRQPVSIGPGTRTVRRGFGIGSRGDVVDAAPGPRLDLQGPLLH